MATFSLHVRIQDGEVINDGIILNADCLCSVQDNCAVPGVISIASSTMATNKTIFLQVNIYMEESL